MTAKHFLAPFAVLAVLLEPRPLLAVPKGNLFAMPTRAEIRATDQWWNAQRLDITEPRIVGRSNIVAPTARYGTHLIKYRLNGESRCGAILLPKGSATTTVIDLSDIRWDYPPRDISNGPHVSTVLGERAPSAAIIIPCFRGMELRVGDSRMRADGDRKEAWAEAALDASAFLTVARQLFPNLPFDTVAYGYSRGGAVALLLGQRDKRISRVAAFAAPTDFFNAMRKVPGPEWERTLLRRIAQGNPPTDSRAYQYVDWFFDDLDDRASVRARMVRASPLYFARLLPPTRVYQGSEDGAVPPANALLIRQEANRLNRSDVKVHMFDGSGHFLQGSGAYAMARSFIVPEKME